MIGRTWAAAILLSALAAGSAEAKAAIEQVRISPDGQALVMVLADGAARSISVETAVDHKTLRTIDPGGQKVVDVQWAGPRHLIVTTAKTGYVIGVDSEFGEHLTAIDYNLETGKSQQLLRYGTEKRHVTLNTVTRTPQVRNLGGQYVVFAEGVSYIDTPSADGYYTNYAKDGTATLFRIDLERDDAATQTIGFEHTRGFAVAAAGPTLAESEYDAPAKRWSLKLYNGKWREVPGAAPGAAIDLPGLGRDGAAVLVGARDGARYVLREVTAEGVWSDPLPVTGPDGLVFDPKTHALIGGKGEDGAFTALDPAVQRTWRAIAAAYPGQIATPVSLSEDRRKWVVMVASPTEGRAYALVDLDAKTAALSGDATP